MNQPVILPSGQVLSATTIATAKGISQLPEPPKITKLLLRLQASLAAEMRYLRQQPAKEGYAAPRDWADTTFFLLVRCVLDSQLACEAAGILLSTLCDFTSGEAVGAIVRHYTGPGKEGQNAARVLRGLCTVLRRRDIVIPGFMCMHMRRLARMPRRTEDKELPTLDVCLDAAFAAFEAAVAMIVEGHRRRGRTRMRDAVILAVEILTNFRRGEFSAITLDVVFFDENRAEVKIIIPETASKVREVQFGIIRNSKVVDMLRCLANQIKSGSIFRTNGNKPLAPADAYRALRRTSGRSIGIELSFNEARRIGVTSEHNLSAMRARTRHRSKSNIAEDTYSWHADDIGIEKCRNVLRNYT